MDGAYYRCARKFGVKEKTLDLLYALDDGEPHTQRQICGDWMLPKTTVNTSVKELVEAGYAELLPETNGRGKTIRLTEAGRKRAEEIMRGVHAAELAAFAKTLEKFSPEFVDAIEYLAERYREEVEKLPARPAEEL